MLVVGTYIIIKTIIKELQTANVDNVQLHVIIVHINIKYNIILPDYTDYCRLRKV